MEVVLPLRLWLQDGEQLQGLPEETTRILESIPDMFTAFFSVLAPGKHIPLHRGPYRGLLRCHLALVVPEPRQDCWIEVGGETSTWEEGRCIVFDDTYRHRVENNTGGRRVVLFIDVKRPLEVSRVVAQPGCTVPDPPLAVHPGCPPQPGGLGEDEWVKGIKN